MICRDIYVTGIYNMLTVPSERGRYMRVRDRFCHALSFCESGSISYVQNGQRIVSDRDHAVFLPQGHTYELHGDSDGSFPLINFYTASPFCDGIMRVRLKNPESYLADYEQMRRLMLFEGNIPQVLSIFYGMLHRMFTQSSTSGVLAPAINCIETDFTDKELSNERLAGLCGISEVYFRRLFIEQYGMTPRQFIIDVRIKRAKQLLGEGMLGISEVAENCGFGDQYHFSRMFRRKTGITPSEYRKEAQSTLDEMQ